MNGRVLGIAGGFILFLAGALWASPRNADDRESLKPAAPRPAVVLELFTSQGCSSCPPADDLLRELGAAEDVYALSFHVDYWDRLGWKDPFGSAAWTGRQRDYQRTLSSGRIYTPQAVVNGRAGVVGSKRDAVLRLIAAAREKDSAGLVEFRLSTAGPAKLELVGKFRLTAPHPDAVGVVTALVESGLETRVGTGENGGRKLRNDFVVRSLSTIATIPARSVKSHAGSGRIAVDPAWKRENLRIVTFLQDSDSFEIYGATAHRVPGV